MYLSRQTFNTAAIVIAIQAVMLIPLWHFLAWGYLPSALLATLLLLMLLFKRLSRDQ